MGRTNKSSSPRMYTNDPKSGWLVKSNPFVCAFVYDPALKAIQRLRGFWLSGAFTSLTLRFTLSHTGASAGLTERHRLWVTVSDGHLEAGKRSLIFNENDSQRARECCVKLVSKAKIGQIFRGRSFFLKSFLKSFPIATTDYEPDYSCDS